MSGFAALEGLEHFGGRLVAPGVAKPARVYNLRCTFASRALAAGVSAFELGPAIGTSAQMIERHYGTPLDGARASIASRADAYDAEQEQAARVGPTG